MVFLKPNLIVEIFLLCWPDIFSLNLNQSVVLPLVKPTIAPALSNAGASQQY